MIQASARRGRSDLAALGATAVAAAVAAAGFGAPVARRLRRERLAAGLYRLGRLFCHQRASRSFFLFGQRPVYTAEDLCLGGIDPRTGHGSGEAGWKTGLCQRDLALATGLAAFGTLAILRPPLRPWGLARLAASASPLFVDGLSQVFGVRESTWWLRVASGLLLSLGAVSYVYPRLLSPADGADEAPERREPGDRSERGPCR